MTLFGQAELHALVVLGMMVKATKKRNALIFYKFSMQIKGLKTFFVKVNIMKNSVF